ncbi:hypothetical protein NLJ89_g10396 [Agrocybe chaxingu]|uniref:Uncharacterized protein n=1 Tax=Agrocybe chaxingu TaxID=84603 RepID=A0A9W8JRT3_9AGAR|nr:hypothetical protein NLJ89_g10396 [Agrocybe chaxingu]
MPTATSTVTTPPFSAQIPLKAGLKASKQPAVAFSSAPTMGQTSTGATLRSLYSRATRAFVLKDMPTTYSLIQSAFSILKPPTANPDSLSEYRRKWDILRITFESTVYATPAASSESLPESLRASLAEPPQALVTSIYNRSLSLFTPSNGTTFKNTVNAAFLPGAVLTTLVYCSIKLDAPDVGRVMIEDWLARREPRYSLDVQEEAEGNGYEKVLELYCLHILPKVEQWEYAKEFLEYESELPVQQREHLKAALSNLYSQR